MIVNNEIVFGFGNYENIFPVTNWFISIFSERLDLYFVRWWRSRKHAIFQVRDERSYCGNVSESIIHSTFKLCLYFFWHWLFIVSYLRVRYLLLFCFSFLYFFFLHYFFYKSRSITNSQVQYLKIRFLQTDIKISTSHFQLVGWFWPYSTLLNV